MSFKANLEGLQYSLLVILYFPFPNLCAFSSCDKQNQTIVVQ